MPALERLAMIHSQIELDKSKYVPSFPYMSLEERAKYDPEKFYKSTYNKLPPSPLIACNNNNNNKNNNNRSPGYGYGCGYDRNILPHEPQQISLQSTSARSPSRSPPLPSRSPSPPRTITPVSSIRTTNSPAPSISEDVNAGEDMVPVPLKQNLNLNELVKRLDKEKVLCINKNQEKIDIMSQEQQQQPQKDDDDDDENDENDTRDGVFLQESINDISEETVSQEYDVIILNQLGQQSNYEMSLYLKSIRQDVIIVIRDELKPDSQDDDYKNCQYDYYVDLSDLVIEAPGKETSDQ